MSHDISKSYHPLILEVRETAVEVVEPLKVFNNRVVLTEIPDTFQKVYLNGYTEIENRIPVQGEFLVDYKTGIITMGGSVVDKTVVNASYYGKGIIQYPAERIYSHNPTPDVAGNLQKIIDRGELAIVELNNQANMSKRINHSNSNTFLANQDWTPLIYHKSGSGEALYNSSVKGVEITGDLWVKVNIRMPIDPTSTYNVRAKVRKVSGDGMFYIGAISLNDNYEEINTDQALTYNYFGTSARVITSGNTEIVEGKISGYNLTSESNANKFDPEAKYFDLVIIANLGFTAGSVAKTAIEWLEIYRSPKSMNVEDNGSFGGTLRVGGQTDLLSNLVMNNKDITRVKKILGEFGTIAESTDEYLRLNADNSHTLGVYFGSSIVRTDGKLHVGSAGATFGVDTTSLTYKTLLTVNATKSTFASPANQFTGTVDIDSTLNVDGNTTLQGTVTVNGGSITLPSGVASFTRNATSPTLYIKQDGTGDIARFGSTTDDSKFILSNDGSVITKGDIQIYKNASVSGTLNVTGATTLGNTLTVTGTSTLNSSLSVSSNAEINGKVWAGRNTTYGASPLLTLTIGDADTGFNWVSDGSFELRANNAIIADFSSTAFNVNKKLNAKASASVTGTLDVSGNTTIGGTLTATDTTLGNLTAKNGTFKNTGVGTTSVDIIHDGDGGEAELRIMGIGQGTGRIYLGQDSTFGGGIEYNGDAIPVSAGGGQDYIALFNVNAGTKNWTARNLYSSNDWEFRGGVKVNGLLTAVASVSVTGNITVTGTVDGVDVSAFKTAYDSHNHDSAYVNVTGDTMTGGLYINQSANNVALTLQGATSGWASGLLLNNTTATTGKNYGIYSASTGSLMITQEGGVGAILTFASTGNATIAKNLTVSGSLTVSTGLSITGTTTLGATTFNGVVTLNSNMIVSDGMAIVPATANGATLGTVDKPFKDVFIGANSLYVDGNKVVSSTADTIDISTDPDQHLSVNTSGLGTTRLASGKEVILYSSQQVNIQALGAISALSSGGLISFKSDANGSGMEFVSQSTLGNISLTSANLIQLSATNGITFVQTPKVGSTAVQLVTDAIANSRITLDSTHRFITDTERTSWNGKLDKSGGTMTGFITLHADPTSPLHAVTKQYVDAVKQSLDIKESVRVATTANITLSGGQTIDGISLNVGNRVLVKNQTDGKQNGIYIVQTGAWTRAIDFDQDSDVTSGAFVFVEEGFVNGNMGWVLTTDGVINIGVTPISFTQFSGAGQVVNGTGLLKDGNTLYIGDTGVVAGEYKNVRVNAQGQVTFGSNPTTLSGFGITDAISTSGGTVNGNLVVNTNTQANGLYISRTGSTTSEAVKHSVNDSSYDVKYVNDETSSTMQFVLENTDTEGGTGVNSSLHTLKFLGSNTETYLAIDGNKFFHQGFMGSGSGLNADLIDGLHGSQLVRNDTNNTISGYVKATQLIGTSNAFTVTIPAGQTSVTLTHNFGHTNYKATVGVYSVNRHAGLSSKLANTIAIEIDDVYTSDIVVDVILMPTA